MNITRLKNAIRSSWDINTCYPGDRYKWSNNKPEIGQCAVTALIVNDIFGGEILYCENYHHYWNRLTDGTIIDLTKSQFSDDAQIIIDAICDRNKLLYGDKASIAQTIQRYQLLKAKVDKLIKKNEFEQK